VDLRAFFLPPSPPAAAAALAVFAVFLEGAAFAILSAENNSKSVYRLWLVLASASNLRVCAISVHQSKKPGLAIPGLRCPVF